MKQIRHLRVRRHAKPVVMVGLSLRRLPLVVTDQVQRSALPVAGVVKKPVADYYGQGGGRGAIHGIARSRGSGGEGIWQPIGAILYGLVEISGKRLSLAWLSMFVQPILRSHGCL